MKTFPFSRALTLALAGLVSGPVFVAAPPAMAIEASADIASAIELHNAGRAGDTAATQQAIDVFTALMAADPSNVEAIAYLGSSYALSARDSKAVVDKIRYTNRGLRFLDQAVAAAPNDFTVRMIRGNVTASLPAMFGRDATTVEDFMALDQMFSAAQVPSMAPPMVGVYAQLVKLAPDMGDWQVKLTAAQAMAAGQ